MLAVFLALLGCATQDSPSSPQDALSAPQDSLGAPQAFPATFVPREWLVIEAVDARGRRPFRPDAVFAKYLLARDAAPPSEGDALSGELGKEQRWRKVEADANGAIPGNFGYAYTAIESPETVVVMAKLTGALSLFVNGAGFTGDVYAYGFGGVPIVLSKGVNHIYVSGARGTASLVLERPASAGVLATWDFTLPHVPRDRELVFGSALVFNASDRTAAFALRHDGFESSDEPEDIPCERLVPLGLAQVAHELAVGAELAADAKEHEIHYELRADGHALASAVLRTPLVAADANAPKLVFYGSRIDGSIQTVATRGSGRPVLTLHGASVDAWGQVTSYSDHAGFQIIAPRNRRPYGFDWQDWGRIDAYEALSAARTAAFMADPEADEPDPDEPVFVTGHSMGGHGTWHFAANDPDRVLVLAPSAGWCSFDTYGPPRPQGELRALWHAADGASRSEDLVANLAQLPTYVLHGEADDNVPASEGRAMLARLEKAGAKPRSHFQPGAGHWWDGDAAAGADCVDWPAIFELFSATKPRVRAPDELHWRAIDPGVDAEHHWLVVEQPLVYGEPFEVDAVRSTDEIEIETANVGWIAVEIEARKELELDGEEFEVANELVACFARTDGRWNRAALGAQSGKHALRSGPFKRAFDNGFVLVYGTNGTAVEDAELLERARADQQQWWYRANGAPLLLGDAEALGRWGTLVEALWFSHGARPARNTILYGNADTNAAWTKAVPHDFPIRVRRGRVEVEERRYEGENLACVFVAPRADDTSGAALVGVFGSTGVAGARVGYTLQPFTSGVGYPDYVIFSTDVLTKGDGGVLEAGWFDRDWKVQRGGSFRR